MRDISNKSNTLYLLDKYNIKAFRKYGQNFIIDSNIIKKIIDYAHIDKTTTIIEIGPGIGALSEYLAYSSRHVIAYEIDPRFKEVLNESLSEIDNIEIIYEDFLKVDLDALVEQYDKVATVSNMPYYITSDLIEKVVKTNKMTSLTCMIQKEVAEKLISQSTPLSMMLRYRGDIEYCFTLPRSVFLPEPHVESAVIHVEFKNDYDQDLYNTLKICFKQKRKTIYNNLRDYIDRDSLINIEIDPSKRPEELKIEDYIRLSNYLKGVPHES